MATQTDLDRLQIAWARLQSLVNDQLPRAAARARAAAVKAANATSNSGANAGK